MDGLSLAPEIADYYGGKDEARRLLDAADGRLELLRTQEILRRFLPEGGFDVLDVGGGTGVHSSWLTDDGHRCLLIDPMPKHVAAARDAGLPAELGDARDLPAESASFDAVLLMGPLYHLPDPKDRALVLSEAVRVARPGAVVAAAAIGRFASLFENAGLGILARPGVHASVAGIMASGELIKPPPGRFTTAFFHPPALLADEMAAAGIADVQVFGVEGPAWGMLRAAEARGVAIGEVDDPLFASVLAAARLADGHPELLAAASHLLAVGRAANDVP
ncbi:class I SAM-dependent methyltransferase [Catenulispora sp. NL8]|uniref:Class I SAM-dependent methyltransferase n=1 Tax=Catenulispora pinistramenti TaxID=2705254 RepID=A0ABS5KJT7_9ACTN|nr:class I SAM-dependent methyltransferase [Catenulispora pinistramenti]MBS2545316.1 class I SAM-dependent methyltransferase [Catenulispora pinistramenti]